MMKLVPRLAPLVCAVLLSLPVAAGAQHAPELAAGTRVRVADPAAGRIVGTVSEVRGDTLVVLAGKGPRAQLHELSLSSIRSLQVSRGRPPRLAGALEGAALGLATGAVGGMAGAVIPALLMEGDCSREEDLLCMGPGPWAVIGILMGAPVGAGTGAVVGFIHPRERWRRVWVVRPPTVTVQPRADGLQVGLSIALP